MGAEGANGAGGGGFSACFGGVNTAVNAAALGFSGEETAGL